MIVAGFGFRAAAGEESLRDAYARIRAARAPDALASVVDKAEAPALLAFAARLGIPVVAVDPVALRAQRTETQSEASTRARGVGSVAEASALAAAGKGARLLAGRAVSADRLATCALAEGEGP